MDRPLHDVDHSFLVEGVVSQATDDGCWLLEAAYDGPVPPAALAAARWGAGAWERLARGADAAVIEARLRSAISVLGRLRRAAGSAEDLPRLVRAVAQYRRAALACAIGAVA